MKNLLLSYMDWDYCLKLEGILKLMPEKDGKSKILPIIENTDVFQSVKDSLVNEDDLSILKQSASAYGIQPIIAKHEPDIVLIDFDVIKADTHKIIDAIAAQFKIRKRKQPQPNDKNRNVHT